MKGYPIIALDHRAKQVDRSRRVGTSRGKDATSDDDRARVEPGMRGQRTYFGVIDGLDLVPPREKRWSMEEEEGSDRPRDVVAELNRVETRKGGLSEGE